MGSSNNGSIAKQNSIYLDTSVPSAYYDSREKTRQRFTREFWKKLHSYDVFISELVMEELSAVTNLALSRKLITLVKGFSVLDSGEPEMNLANEYINAGAMSSRSLTYALHLAVASINDIDIFVSWNFKHMVNIKTRKIVFAINRTKGYKAPEIISPLEI